ncbi:MAG: transporter substrate-binding domain-containing protein [Vicingus serpentipes]|nr:transporter substrate-binding domain-containing protein [Vicingus serpentipes]
MNKFLNYCLFLFYTLLIVGCGDTDIAPVDRDLSSIKQEGVIKAIINYGPTSYFIYKGIPMGFEYDLLKKYSEHIGVELEIIPMKNRDSIYVYLNKGVGDVVASNFTITKERLKKVHFTHPVFTTNQVLIQRKPDNWKKMSKKNIQEKLLKSPFELKGKTVVVGKSSSYEARLYHLSKEIKGKINVKTVEGNTSLEELIEGVATKKLDYTVADKNIAIINQWRYPNIDISFEISGEEEIAWMTRNNSDSLLLSMNSWLKKFQKTKKYKMLYAKYFKNQYAFNQRLKHSSYTLASGEISPYDLLFKKYAPKIQWDWELLAAMSYQESHFNNNARGWGGAFGLMQFMPQTGAKYGVDTLSGVEENIKAGIRYLRKLDKIWVEHVADPVERAKFVLASYNVGPGHVIDAKNLAKKYGKSSNSWKEVSYFLLYKSKPKYYKDKVVEHGYCKGYIVYDYVNEIMERYRHYKSATEASANLTK